MSTSSRQYPSSSSGPGSSNGKVEVISPISQMVDRLLESKYVATREELEALMKCGNRMRKYGLEGFIAAGAAVWTVTGGLNLLHRLTTTVAGAAAGAYMTAQLSIKPCMEDILSLDGSRFQQELVAILQKEQAHNTRVRHLLQKHFYVEPFYDDQGQGMPGVLLRKRQSTAEALDNSSFGASGLEEEGAPFSEHKPSEPQSATLVSANDSKMNASDLKMGGQESHLFTDPLDMLAWNGPVERSSKPENKENALERQRNRMNVNERREHNRNQYLQWQEKRQQKQNEHQLIFHH